MYSDLYYADEFFSDAVLFGIIIASLVIGLIAYVIYSYIFWVTAKTNGFEKSAYISWIPFFNFYMMFLLGAKGENDDIRRKNAKMLFWIYVGSIILSVIPFIGWILSLVGVVIGVYIQYCLFLRWNGEKNKSILYVVATILTSGLFFYIYGLMRMKRPFKA